MVTFVSQCEKNALKKTRRVLDAFANRIGDNTWQTIITEEGLATVKKMLRQTASKSTAVSCHWIRSRSRSQFLWVVGKKDRFDFQGWVPVNVTEIAQNWRDDRADWHYFPLIQALAAMSALLHDWGKASERFQQKLAADYKGKGWDALRHEWVSCLLLKAFIGGSDSDEDWLGRLANGDINEQALQEANLSSIQKPLRELPPAAQLIAWLVLSHHRLPFNKECNPKNVSQIDHLLDIIDASWGYENSTDINEVKACLRFPKGLISDSSRWLKAVKRWAQKLLTLQHDIQQVMDDGSIRLILHHARLSLMLADHCYSSKDSDPDWQGGLNLIANTKKGGEANQRLDQHLVRVCDFAKNNARNLPNACKLS